MATKRIGILTGGGDVPGLNSVIKGVVYRGSEMDIEVTGIRRGWEGLTHVNLEDPQSRARYILPLNRANTRTIDRTGGTFLHTSRTNPAKMKEVPEHLKGKEFPRRENTKKGVTSQVYDITTQVLKNLEALQLDYLIAIGGDDTLSYAARLDKEGFPVVCIPKTMDNDVRNTEYCIGFSTAITRATDAIERQRTTVGSHERVGIFRVFGRDAGHTALYTAYVSFDSLLHPRVQGRPGEAHRPAPGRQAEQPEQLLAGGPVGRRGVGRLQGQGVRRARRLRPPQEDERGRGLERRDQAARAGEETVVSDLTYDLRGGSPDFVDKLVATTYANMALDAISAGKSGRHDGDRERLLHPCPRFPIRSWGPATSTSKLCTTPSVIGRATTPSSAMPIFLTRA